ncbi:MAG: hypothetical protein UU73_C0003G0274 [Candidatus Daviesbacteria bacterium GW2011_GWA1_41_61]|nr:MAG: hypothetical protein UU26_C0004G0008 [Candidatus Daviesbacteria bacterium GW2011_GWC1_40_9]KKR93376.1 MAG: hypothetical protein UU44_C0002G0037 [Candidatus Daviesbacteria bacterium GW2011_GWB1_41_15]KKS15075.1 MAG: hypothetical protein UU73_C0003G0274 [Candidatus Daviesbacteria bacterium GW2011_GWA1_41_61]
MIKKLKKTLSVITVITLLFSQVATVTALEAPTSPAEPTPRAEQSAPPPPPAEPTPPEAPTLESLLEPSPAPTENSTLKEISPTSTESLPEETLVPPSTPSDTPTESLTEDTSNSSNTTPPIDNEVSQTTGGESKDGEVGDPQITTGNALNTATVTTSANENYSAATLPGDSSVTVENTDNGSRSDNSASLNSDSGITTVSNNLADAQNSLDLDTNTGKNSTSENVGSSSIDTGDANTTVNLITALNTNLAGVAVSEFNVVDDQNGDLILNLAAGCVLGCSAFSDTLVANTDNGTDSTNSAQVEQTSDSQTFQNNDATLENNLTLSSNSGDNDADKNTGGDSTITTGDANAAANVLNFINNNIAGQVVLGIVNIFGDLIGDIILPVLGTTSTTTVSNTDNGSGSQNTATLDQDSTNQTFQTNIAQIENNLNLQAATGDNETNKNTGGSSQIQTGDANVDSQTLNIANSNITGGDWWLVLVNEAGEWVGKIIGSSYGTNYAGSKGTQFTINSSGDITATNQGNGSDSQNTASIDQTASNTTVQNNVAKILNNINLFANTGGNSASKNTGGNSSITTGDANIVANLVNFVNNNIVGGGRLTVVTINVFGKWIGDFVGPGYQKEVQTENTTQAGNNPVEQGNQQSNQTALSNSNSQNNQSAPANNTNTSVASAVAEPIKKILHTGGLIYSNNDSEDAAEVAGESFEETSGGQAVTLTKGTQNEAKTITFNLAWLLPLAPLLLILTLATKKLRDYGRVR